MTLFYPDLVELCCMIMLFPVYHFTEAGLICRNSRITGTNPHQSVPSVTSQPVASSQTGNSVEMYRII